MVKVSPHKPIRRPTQNSVLESFLSTYKFFLKTCFTVHFSVVSEKFSCHVIFYLTDSLLFFNQNVD